MGEEKNKKQSESFWSWNLFKWSMGGVALKNQIENYNTLKFFSSARKSAVAIMIFSLVIGLILNLVKGSLATISEAWLDILLVFILAFFVYKGHKWAIIGAMIYWTIDRMYAVVNSFSTERPGDIGIIFIWWTFYMSVFWKAYQVEKERKKEIRQKEGLSKSKEESFRNQLTEKDYQYCPKCGFKLSKEANFCRQCGFKIR